MQPFYTSASLHCSRMQNLNLNGNSDNKIYHYCYVCNTQLNSCKQALLHCSGKRHRKKVQFLQSRKGQFPNAVPPVSPDDSQSSVHYSPMVVHPPAAPPAHGNAIQQSLLTSSAPNGTAGPTLVTVLPTGAASPMLTPTANHAPGCFYPYMAPVDNWIPPQMTPHPPTLIHLHGHYGLVSPPHHYQHQNHLPVAPPQLLPIRHSIGHNKTCPQAQPRPLLRYHESLRSTESSSPVMLADMSPFGSTTDTRSFIISPSETSSISSESLISPKTRIAHRCQVCQRQFITNSQLQVHLQTSGHYKQCLAPAGCRMDRTGDVSEAESWVSPPSIYYCVLCNIAVNSPTQLEAHLASLKHKQHAQTRDDRTESRSSSTSSDANPIEIIMDSGYVSGSGDELICISHPTSDKPTAKFRCQICNIFLNSPSQAKQHLDSQKHRQRASCIRPVFRRKSVNSAKRKQPAAEQSQAMQQQQTGESNGVPNVPSNGETEGECAAVLTRPLDTSSPDDMNEDDTEDDNVTLVRCCHSN